MTRATFARVVALLLAGFVVSCGGGGGGGSTTTTPTPPSGGGPTPPTVTVPTAGMRVEESDASVTFTGTWTKSDSSWGWSGGSAVQATGAGATVSVRFSGTSIRWLGSRGRGMGIAQMSVDGGPVREVDLFAHPTDEVHTPIATIYDLADTNHTLTITVTGRQNSQALGNAVVIDAFDIQPGFTVSHWQDTNPDLKYTGGWTKSSNNFPWSGSGVSNLPELPVTAHESSNAGDTMTVSFRGTGINWIGFRGPDAGIAQVQMDGGTPTTVDLYAASATFQPVVWSLTGMTDGTHTLTIKSTGTKNAAASGARVVVDALDIITPGRRYEEYEKSIAYVGNWTPDNQARVWSEGETATSNIPGTTATFTFTGTSVSWIGCEKDSAAGTADIILDGTLVQSVRLGQDYPVEGYQMTIFRKDGLANTQHTLQIKVTNIDQSYVVVDAFDVH